MSEKDKEDLWPWQTLFGQGTTAPPSKPVHTEPPKPEQKPEPKPEQKPEPKPEQKPVLDVPALLKSVKKAAREGTAEEMARWEKGDEE
jgi:hypothetical protein